jgi:hypothetical protein
MVALLALALAGALPPLSPDWTTRQGKTYHDVHDEGHNSLEVKISSEEGNAWIQLADLPSDIQRHYGYDAQKEAAMNAYLPLLRNESITEEISTPEEIQNYATHVKRLVGNPALLHTLPETNLTWLQENRLIGAGYVGDKMPRPELQSLVHDETQLIGLIVMELESRMDRSIDMAKARLIPTNDLPFGFDPGGPQDRHAYDEMIAEREKQRAKMRHNFMLQRSIQTATWLGAHYIRVMYGHPQFDDKVSIEQQVRPVMEEAKIDAYTTDLLLGKYKYEFR